MTTMEDIRRYVALIDRNGEGEYFVHAPDLPGFNAGGEASLQRAMAVAADVLRDWAELTIEAGGTIAEPRTLDELKADPELAEDFAEAEMVTTIPLLPIAGQKARVNVSLDRSVLAAIDTEARRLKMDRSEYIAAAARHLMAQG